MADQDKKTVDAANLDVTELEEQDLDEVAGGTATDLPVNNGTCPTHLNKGCP